MNQYLRYAVCGVACLVVGVAFAARQTTQFSVGASVNAEAYYCTGASLSASSCSADPSNLIPQTPQVSDEVMVAFDSENPGDLGAVLSDRLWEYAGGDDVAKKGLVFEESLLVGEENNTQKIPVSAFYVPCGETPSGDGSLNGAVPKGIQLGASTPTSIAHSDTSCNQGGNIYLVFDTSKALTPTGFVTPDSYTGTLNLDIQNLSAGV